MKTGTLIKQLRGKNKITLQKLEEKTGIKYNQIIRYEKGYSEPKDETILKILKEGFGFSEIKANDFLNEFKISELKNLLSEKKQEEIFGKKSKKIFTLLKKIF